jgi:hypothetical protein
MPMTALRGAMGWRAPALAAVTLAALAIGLVVVRPFAVAPIGPDAAAPVVEFQRLVVGQTLEGYLSQTSKPLLTLVYGLAYAVAGDWRAVSLAAIVSFALLVALSALLADRLAGRVAAAFVAVGVALSPELLRDVALAYGVSWALLACAVAGLAVTASRPRFGLAGAALAAGALARPEILAVTAFALAFVVVAHVRARVGGAAAPPAGAWLLAVGLLAIPILSVHDWALTRDPLFWANTAQANSDPAGNVRTLREMIVFTARHVLHVAPLVTLATIGVLDRLVRRRWAEACIAIVVPVAVAAFYIASGTRGTLIAQRYLIPIDISLVFAAGIGLGAVDVPRVRAFVEGARPTATRPVLRTVLGIGAGAVLALMLAPSWFGAPRIRASVAAQRAKAAHAAIGIDALRGAIGAVPAWRGVPVPPDAQTLALIPPRLRAQAIADLDLPLWAGTKLFPSAIDPANGRPSPGTFVYHDRADDKPSPAWSAIEVSEPTTVGRLRVVPEFVDTEKGIWVVRIEAADGAQP